MTMTRSGRSVSSGMLRAILWGGLLAGLADALYATLYFGWQGASPVRIWQSVAGGLITRERSVAGGLPTAALGLALHFFSAFTAHDSGVTATLWGVWAASPNDAWAVGGTPEGGTAADNDIVLHWDGSAWTRVELPGEPRGRAHYKTWGASSDDLYVVGEAGTIWHKQGADWALEGEGLAQSTLFTVTGCSATEVYAVGGRQVLRSDGQSWSQVPIELFNDVNGVSCKAPGEVAIVGFGGLKQRLVDGSWIDEFTIEPFDPLHATWSDGEAFWAVGGDWLSKPKPGPREGVVARWGVGLVDDTPP